MNVGTGEGIEAVTKAARWRRVALSAGAVTAALLLSACGGSESAQRGESWMRDTFLFGISDKDREQVAAEAAARAAGQQAEVDYESLPCPPAEIRTIATHYTIHTKDDLPDARTIRYQGTLNRFSRECRFGPDGFTMKYGFSGRLLLGPRGGEGSLSLPVRVDLVATGERVVWSRTHQINVSIGPGETSVPFVQVAEDLAYQPKSGEFLQDFILYVGFEPPEGR